MTDETKKPLDIRGSGGGGKGSKGSARTPVEEPDSLHSISYAAVLDVIANGEVAGPAHPDAPLRDIYLDGTPIQNADGSLNFRDVQVEYRNGTQDQEHIPGFPSSSSVTAVGVEVTAANPWTQLVTNSDLSALRVTLMFPQLMRLIDSGKNAGDRVGVRVEYAIDIASGGGPFQEALRSAADGKSIGGYQRTHRIELPEGFSNWTARVRRLTPDSTSSSISDTIIVQSYAEVIDGKFRYPMSALVGIKIDAEQFQAVPARAYHWRGTVIRVPSNYDPETRTYTGVWDGTLKRAWSNNPAWVFYDILLSPLYGLGEMIDASQVDRYALYQIGAYCDQLVSDGQGGQEPRFVCNAYLQGRNDALRVVQDLASVFRGMAYWANGQVVGVADMPADPSYTYTNDNVVEGFFDYTGSDISTRKTVALVSYNDPGDFYRPKVEPVQDRDGIIQYGIKSTEIVAFGASSRGQAQRVGLYALYTSRMETGGVSWAVGLDGVIPQPGSIVEIADRNRAGRSLGGRIASATATEVVTDGENPAKVGDELSVNLPSGMSERRPITGVDGRVITVSPAFSETPQAESAWLVNADDLVAQQVRVVSVAEGEGIHYNINAVLHHPGKFAAIDNGVRLEPLPVSVVPPRVQRAPDNVLITEHHIFSQGTTRHYAEISWDAVEHAVSYDVQWRRDNSDWVIMPRTGTRLVEIADIYSGDYIVRVRAINSLDVPSLWAYSDLTTLDGIIGAPPTVTHLTTTGEIMAIRLDWGYPNVLNIVERIEIRASLNNNFNEGYDLTTLSYPATSYTVYGLGYSTEMWFWARLIDKNGTAGEWYPLSTGAGVYGRPDQSPANILEYLEGQIGEGQLAPGLIEEIQEGAAEGIVDEIMEEIVGDLTGDTAVEGTWYAGDDDDDATFVGTVNTTTVINEGDYLLARQTYSLLATTNENTAAIRQVQEVFVDEFQAVAEMVTTLAVEVQDMEAVVQENSTAVADLDGALSASWQVKTQVRSDGRVVQAGVALGASIDPDGTTRSEILLMADTIAFLNTLNGELHSPFIFDVANDTAFLNTAFIQNATIGTAKLQDWLESDAIGPGGVPALRLNFRTGEIHINSGLPGGGRLLIDDLGMVVYDGNGIDRVTIGWLGAR